TTPQAKRHSWCCRSSLKGTKRRKSLPPIHQDVTELSKSISLDLPGTDRLSMLILSCFQFSAQKLEHDLKQTEGFSPEAFKAKVQLVSGDLRRYVQKLELDGLLKSCVEDPQVDHIVPRRLWEDLAVASSLWEGLRGDGWEQRRENQIRNPSLGGGQLEQCRSEQGRAEPWSYEGTSQAAVLGSKPDYGRVLQEQGEVLSCMRLVLDELQQAATVLQSFLEDSTQFLRQLSDRLAARTFRRLESSPVRKLLAAPPKKRPAPDG
ncbi:DSN1 protein, partial [Heliornis fulica]|nr:DSN1 protein [Heliornis fulica]